MCSDPMLYQIYRYSMDGGIGDGYRPLWFEACALCPGPIRIAHPRHFTVKDVRDRKPGRPGDLGCRVEIEGKRRRWWATLSMADPPGSCGGGGRGWSTRTRHAPAACHHRHDARRAARAPDSTSLVASRADLTYAALEARTRRWRRGCGVTRWPGWVGRSSRSAGGAREVQRPGRSAMARWPDSDARRVSSRPSFQLRGCGPPSGSLPTGPRGVAP